MEDIQQLNIIRDGNKIRIVVVPRIIFKGKRTIDWNEVEKYLMRYVGNTVEIEETKELVYIGREFPNEYKGSNYSKKLRGALLKAKANAVQIVDQMIQTATGKTYMENRKEKSKERARNGWYYYKTYFAIPVYMEEQKTDFYNLYSARLVMNHTKKKLYLYDMVDIKKEDHILIK